MYRTLDAQKLHATIDRLQQRIRSRFPDSSLGRLALEMSEVSLEAQARIDRIRRPILPLRAAVACLLLAGAGLLITVPLKMKAGEVETILGFVQIFEPALGSLFFLSAFVVFLMGMELRVKRERVLTALHELRAQAHIVDMHQLTKDPNPLLDLGPTTAVSPIREMSPFELSRYFDYCSELLSLISKIAALYVQDLKDARTLTAVDQIEDLCNGLSRKIWQKIMLLQQSA